MNRQLLGAVISVFLCTHVAVAQVNTGTISGSVRDSSGAVIPGAKVTVNNADTGVARTAATDQQGRYRAPNLPVGNYRVEVQLEGFQTGIRSGIELTVGWEAVVDVVLIPGAITEKVTVLAEAPLVDTNSATLSGLVQEKEIRDLPLNGRSLDQLVLLQPGILWNKRVAGTGGFSQGGGKFSISGARPYNNSFLLDGTDANDPRNAMPGSVGGFFLGVDTIREFRVLTNAYSSQYGRAMGGVIIAVTRSGSNQLNGSVFEFLRNSALDAKNFYDRGSIPAFKRNQYGFTAGGPIVKNSAFFFGSYEGLRDRLGLTRIATFPNASARQGILPGVAPFTVADAVKPLLSLYPIPNGRDFGDGTGEYIFSASSPTNESYFMTRVDQRFSSNHSVFARFTFDNGTKTVPGMASTATSLSNPNQATSNRSRNQYLTVEEDAVLSASMLNALRFGFTRALATETVQFTNLPSGFSFVPGVSFGLGGEFDVSGGFPNFGYQRDPRQFAYNLPQGSDDFTYAKGDHTLKTGFVIERMQFNYLAYNAQAGYYTFSGLANFLRGQSNRFIAATPGNNSETGWRSSMLAFYVHDDFHVRPRLTLNLGVREEFMTAINEVNGKSSNLPDVMMKAPIVGNPFFNTFKNNWAPRLGFAWDTMGSGKIVLRGGYGLFYDQPFPTYWRSQISSLPPFNVLGQINNPPFPNAAALLLDPRYATPGDLRPWNYTGTTYGMQYNFSIQSEILPGVGMTVGYAGSQGRKLVRTGQMNTKVPVLVGGRQFFPATAPLRNSTWAGVRIATTDANSNYNALLVSVEKRLSHGLRLQGSYTYSKTMSDADAVFGSDLISGEHQVMDPYNPRLDRAPSSFSMKHSLVFSYSYEVPFSGAGFSEKLLKGWQLNGITTINSGTPFPVTAQCCSGNGSTASAIQERPDLLPGKNNNPILGGPDKYFDDSVFALAAPGYYGNLGRNTTIGPGLATVDFSLIKNTAITEKLNLQFRGEFFNILNHANFSTPAFVVFDQSGKRLANAGRITSTDTASRQIQLALKLLF